MSNLQKAIFTLKENFFSLRKDGNNPVFRSSYFQYDKIIIAIQEIIIDKKLDLSFRFEAREDYLQLIFFDSEGNEKIVSSEKLFSVNDFLEYKNNITDTLLSNNISFKEGAINPFQDFGKAKSYFKRYMLLDFFCLADGDDCDANELTIKIEKNKKITAANKLKELLKLQGFSDKDKQREYLQNNYKELYNKQDFAEILRLERLEVRVG